MGNGSAWGKIFKIQIDAFESVMEKQAELLIKVTKASLKNDQQSAANIEDKGKSEAKKEMEDAQKKVASNFGKLFATYDTNNDSKLDDAEVESLTLAGFKEMKEVGPKLVDLCAELCGEMADSQMEIARIQLNIMKKSIPKEALEAMGSQLPNIPSSSEIKKKMSESVESRRQSFLDAYNKNIDDSITNIKQVSQDIFTQLDENKDKSVSKEEFTSKFAEAALSKMSMEKATETMFEACCTSIESIVKGLFPGGL